MRLKTLVFGMVEKDHGCETYVLTDWPPVTAMEPAMLVSPDLSLIQVANGLVTFTAKNGQAIYRFGQELPDGAVALHKVSGDRKPQTIWPEIKYGFVN